MSDKTKRITLELRQADSVVTACAQCHLANCHGAPIVKEGGSLDCGELGYWALLPEAPQ